MRMVLEIGSNNRSRNNGFKVEKLRNRKVMGRNWWSTRMVNEWNGLSTHIASRESMRRFKRR